MKTTKTTKYKKPDNAFIEDVIVTMLEGGSNYWIDHVKAGQQRTKGVPVSVWVANIVNKGGTVYIFPQGENKGYGLTKPRLIAGIQRWVEKHPRQVSIIDGEIDAGQIDAGDADAILQYALFGKLVYG